MGRVEFQLDDKQGTWGEVSVAVPLALVQEAMTPSPLISTCSIVMLAHPKMVLQSNLIPIFVADDPCTYLYVTLLISTAFFYIFSQTKNQI